MSLTTKNINLLLISDLHIGEFSGYDELRLDQEKKMILLLVYQY